MTPRLSWLWPVLVVALFCAPLFVGLHGNDLRGDEAIYSFAVDRMLETRDWLIPRGSPSEDALFFEKPPLKIWIVAGAMRLGLTPHDEFGMRFWDVLFSGVAFLYVFAIGRRIAGPLCGALGVLALFIHAPLLFEHGVRENNMEAPLFLAYCGGVYHYLAWTSAKVPRSRWWQAVAVGMFFTLGFMVKFVAALFLPLVLGVAALTLPSHRRALLRDWRIWRASIGISLLLIVPWFAYCHFTYGREFWHVLLQVHVYQRMTVGMDPSHVHSGGFYFSHLYEALEGAHIMTLTAIGGALLLIDTIRRRWAEGFVVLLWFALPLALVSLATSKLYYYAYPFIPPVGLAFGYLFAWIWRYVQPWGSRGADNIDRWITARWPGVLVIRRRSLPRRALTALAAVAAVVLLWTMAFGVVVVSVHGVRLFKNGGFLRPWIAAAVLGMLAGRAKEVGLFLIVSLLLLWLVPVQEYRELLPRLTIENHPMRSLLDCVQNLRTTMPADSSSWRGLYVAGPQDALGHGHYYYFRRLRPWERDDPPVSSKVYRSLYDSSAERPVLIAALSYGAFKEQLASAALPADFAAIPPPVVVKLEDALLLLPGVYRACDQSARGYTVR